MEFKSGPIDGVKVMPFRRHVDERGWLTELFRTDDLPESLHPAMSYLSETLPGVLRGPHEHVDQTDYFAWVGPGDFKVTLWDNRPESPTLSNRMEIYMGVNHPGAIVVPPGIVHCYRCIGVDPGWVINLPNRLYAGVGRQFPVDEIRHEDDPDNPFVKDEISRRARM